MTYAFHNSNHLHSHFPLNPLTKWIRTDRRTPNHRPLPDDQIKFQFRPPMHCKLWKRAHTDTENSSGSHLTHIFDTIEPKSHRPPLSNVLSRCKFEKRMRAHTHTSIQRDDRYILRGGGRNKKKSRPTYKLTMSRPGSAYRFMRDSRKRSLLWTRRYMPLERWHGFLPLELRVFVRVCVYVSRSDNRVIYGVSVSV